VRICRRVGLLGALTLWCTAGADVVINEVFVNPPSTLDDSREFIELMGTPGKKLDGYAIAIVNGTQQKFYPLGSIPPVPTVIPEIDEFFSLDGLSLGKNGLLVLGIQGSVYFPTLLSDTNFTSWQNIWNGGLDVPGKIGNDGSITVLLLRKRPGKTQADPNNPLGLRWGKDINVDYDLLTPVIDPQDGQPKDQFGNGGLDTGQADGMGGFTLDLRGASTPNDLSDDLEIVDEFSSEHDRGWEYDTDGRRVDVGSIHPGLPERRVHALDDPAGFNPDAYTRVDYRSKGPGYQPVAGATGQMQNGNNWQDTATEQWIRGEAVTGSGGQGDPPYFFFSNLPNSHPDAIQPYETHVPLWLNDGIAPDYDFGTHYTYQIMAGRVNPLAVPFIPGDTNRDGAADAEDILRIREVFGDDDWVFSNSFAPNNSGDPAAQLRPWQLDQTGNNGIEASDLQWALNFQGNTNGRIVGVRYDSTSPSTTGVYLNPNSSVTVSVFQSVNVSSGRPINALRVGDAVEMTVSAQVTSGANNASGQQNGVMQFAHDVTISTSGVLRVVSVEALAPFETTRSSLQSLVGSNGDRGVRLVNGFTTDFTQGLGSVSNLYRVTFQAIGLGSTQVTVAAADEPKFAASTPRGLKVGHTDNNGNPVSANYPASLNVSVTEQATEHWVSGKVTFQNLAVTATPPTLVNIDVYVDGNYYGTLPTTLGPDGSYSLLLPAGQITLKLKHTHWLRKAVSTDNSSGDVSGVNISLINGDADGDNSIGLADLNVVLLSFGSSGGSADLDEDGSTGLPDLNIVLLNFGKTGDT